MILHKLNPSTRSIIRKANAARDGAQWDKAAKLYQEAVHFDPRASLFVQLGHAKKEMGDLDGAEQAYLTAQKLQPDDMDIPLQLGHLYKARNDSAAAATCYRMALAGGLDDEHARHFLNIRNETSAVAPALTTAAYAGAAVTASNSATLVAMTPGVYIDYSDLIAYFGDSRAPTGIQRVQIELFKASLSWSGDVPVRSCAYSSKVGFWVTLDPVSFSEVCTLAATPGTREDSDWRDAIGTLSHNLGQSKTLSFPPGSILVNLGSSWWMQDYMALIRQAKARFGIRYVPLMYDMIPLITPDYVGAGLTSTFAAWASSVFMHADLVGAISECTRHDVERYAQAVKPLAHEPVVMPLDAWAGEPRSRATDRERDRVLEGFNLRRGGFVLFVSTIEIRKNHQLVFAGWQRLIASEGADKVPTLVCVGKQGHGFDQLQAFLNAHEDLQDKVRLLSGISDLELETLYADCLFTLYASFYEGWGLPVTESLCHGKVIVAARHSSIPEAGGKFAVYYDSDSVGSFIEQVRVMMFDAHARNERESLIRMEYRPRSWSEVLEQFVRKVVDALPLTGRASAVHAQFDYATRYLFRQRPELCEIDRAVAVAEMSRFESDWQAPDSVGIWATRPRARLVFSLPDEGNGPEELLLFVEVRSDGPYPVRLRLRLNSRRLGMFTLSRPGHTMLQARIPADANIAGEPVMLQFEVDGAGRTERGICLTSLMICRSSDWASRLDVAERLVMLIAE